MNIRHGDVNLSEITSLEGYEKIAENDFILAEGEKTGHHHRILPKTIDDTVEVFQDINGNIAVRVNGEAILTHQEHKTLVIPTGIYKKFIEREKDWFSLAVRKVID